MRQLILLISATVTLSATPQLRLSTTTLGPIYVEVGSNAIPQSVNLFNIGDGAIAPAVTFTSAAWVSANIGQPTMCANGPVMPCIPLSVTLNTTGLSPGTYNEYITVADPNAIDAPQNIGIVVQVNGPPSTLDFYVTPNNGTSTAQSDTASMTINLGGNNVISTVKTSDDTSWLSFSFTSNQVSFSSYQLRVASLPGQPEGTYTGSVLLSNSLNAPDNGVITVNLHVTSQPILPTITSPITFNLIQGGASQTYNIPLQNQGFGTLNVSAAFTSGAAGVSALPNGSNLAVTATPASLTPGSYTGSITLASNAANTSTPMSVRVIVSPALPGPVAGFGGVVDNAAFARGQTVASGSIAALFGAQLSSSGPANASGFPLPTTLGGVQVLLNGTAVPLFYVDANQIDFQVPTFFGGGQVTVQVVRDGQAGNRITTTLDPLAPRLFALRQFAAAADGNAFGAVYNSDNTLAGPANLGGGAHPARRGDILTIYALGLGPVSPNVNTGDPAPSSEPYARVTNQVQVVFGGSSGQAVTATPIFAGLAPGFAGLYQMNVLLPQEAPTGNVPVSVTMPGHNSNVVEMSVAGN